MQENTILDISTGTATSTAQDFLNTIPAHHREALSSTFLCSLEKELQAELQALIQSRLLWSQQAVCLEIAEQQRLEKPMTAPESSEIETNSQQLVPTLHSVAKGHTLGSRKVTKSQKSPLQDSQLDVPALSSEALKSHKPLNAPEPSREEILKQYNVSLKDFLQPRNVDATPRRRRRRAAALP